LDTVQYKIELCAQIVSCYYDHLAGSVSKALRIKSRQKAMNSMWYGMLITISKINEKS
jgi:hypothetical protein